MIFAIQLNYNKVSNFLVTYVVSTKFILFSLLKIYVTTPLHMGLINFKIIGKINIAFVFSCIQISFISLFTMDGTCLRLLSVVLVFNPIDLLKEVADPIHLKNKWKSARAGWF